MGTWRFTMPLLTTLAALVIIVHSLDEDLDPEYRHDISPRLSDTGSQNYDEPWRAMDVAPATQRTTFSDTWNDNPEIPLKRRRPGARKRKRRPQVTEDDDLVPQERYVDPEEPQQYRDVGLSNTNHMADTPRRRRRKQSRPNWNDARVEPEISLRRRGQRRKRPSLEPWPLLSEFGNYETEKDSSETQITTEPNVQFDYENMPANNEQEHNVFYSPQQFEVNSETLERRRLNVKATKNKLQNQRYPMDGKGPHNTVKSEEKSLSEFSFEAPEPALNPATNFDDNLDVRNKLREKSPIFNQLDKIKEKLFLELRKLFYRNDLHNYVSTVLQNRNTEIDLDFYRIIDTVAQLKAEEKIYDSKEIEKDTEEFIMWKKCKDKIRSVRNDKILKESNALMREEINLDQPIDPNTLKEVLKRSNGTSLSEILQQHNLSLADLLSGKENAISALKADTSENQHVIKNIQKPIVVETISVQDSSEETLANSEERQVTQAVTEPVVTTQRIQETEKQKNIKDYKNKEDDLEISSSGKLNNDMETSSPRMVTRRRFPTDVRRKLRMRPKVNITFKGQLSRDLMAFSPKRYLYSNGRNTTKSREWKEVIPTMVYKNSRIQNNSKEEDDIQILSTTLLPEITTVDDIQDNASSTIIVDVQTISVDNNIVLENTTRDTTQTTHVSTSEEITTETAITTEKATVITTEKPKVTPILRPTLNSGLRRQAYNNRLKKKRLKAKSSTTENPQNKYLNDLFGVPGIVSASEFISKMQTTHGINEHDDLETTLEDFITTEKSKKVENGEKLTRESTMRPLSTRIILKPSTTEETAKFEIEEILNDTHASLRLSKILMERNMTLHELVEHRERGSSHVHLADIFHNASKEPNPPEPFLSKSLIEPISKETYPLRAILEANLLNATGKTSVDPNPTKTQYVNIPVVMDFGNNVNENGENMGIMTLFNNFTKTELNKNILNKALDDVPNDTDIKTTDVTDTTRESRALNVDQDLVTWNDIFEMMRRNKNNEVEASPEPLPTEKSPPEPFQKIALEEDIDGDGLIVLEDLQHLKDFESNIASASDEKLEVNMYDSSEAATQGPGILNTKPSHTKSVTVATASIVGLAMVLFLLTYVVFKWKQQKKMLRKKQSFCDDHIPTPVFEHRKGHRNNSSSRSISPMISTANIYTLNTLDSQNGKESPDYMWDTLRKPFQ